MWLSHRRDHGSDRKLPAPFDHPTIGISAVAYFIFSATYSGLIFTARAVAPDYVAALVSILSPLTDTMALAVPAIDQISMRLARGWPPHLIDLTRNVLAVTWLATFTEAAILFRYFGAAVDRVRPLLEPPSLGRALAVAAILLLAIAFGTYVALFYYLGLDLSVRRTVLRRGIGEFGFLMSMTLFLVWGAMLVLAAGFAPRVRSRP